MATGVDITNAHGQAITKSVMACCNQWLKSKFKTKTGTTNSKMESASITGV